MTTKAYVDAQNNYNYLKDTLVVIGSKSESQISQPSYFASKETYERMIQTNEFKVACNLLENEYRWFYIMKANTGQIIYRSQSINKAISFIQEPL
jgi:hypothetical protein